MKLERLKLEIRNLIFFYLNTPIGSEDIYLYLKTCCKLKLNRVT
jgi:hypothetical protein